jgi:oligoribonuclease
MRKLLIIFLMLTQSLSWTQGTTKSTLFWIDLEMTGLNPENDLIIQTAAIVTDDNLNIVAELPDQEIHYDCLPEMDPFVVTMHTTSGLLQKVKQSTITLAQAEQRLIQFYNTYCAPNNNLKPILCGDCVWHDRKFLDQHMPKFAALLHYEILDISCFKQVMQRWYPHEYEKYEKNETQHTAHEDTMQAIADLQFYRQYMFKPN